MTYETILSDVEDGICTIRLNRPEKLNAWTRTMQHELHDAMHGDAAQGTGAVSLDGRLIA